MNTPCRYLLWISTACIIAVCFCVSCRQSSSVEQYVSVGQPARISPDYTDTVIPPNIAPLNFRVLETGEKFFVKISAPHGNPILIHSRNANIKIPLKPWQTLLNENRGGKLSFDIFVFESANGWRRYQALSNVIANENIDPYLVYRLTGPLYNFWKTMGIYQRNIADFKTKAVLRSYNPVAGESCINCHTFINNSPENMIMGFRNSKFGIGTLVARGGNVDKIDSKWGYTVWHPSGKLAVYSMNKVVQFFHTDTSRIEDRDVADLDSAIVYYLFDTQQTKRIPSLTQKDNLETFPAWSPDGKYLYYSCGKILWENREKVPPKDYDRVKYDLMRISYDIRNDQWGQPETVLSAEQTGLSILQPRISPDGKFLLFCMCQYSGFPAFQISSDFYMMDLSTGRYKKLDAANSDRAESWHSWSSNCRWITFSSKRRGGPFTDIYFSYIDAEGNASKAFILPQEDPEHYDSLVKIYNLPELITGPVEVSSWKLAKTIRSSSKIKTTIPITGATPTTQSSEPYQQGQR
jgi:hypothetical protein